VFLAGDRVYKVKRAVKFPFLDFSDAAKRKAACEAELEVNRPFAPELYRRVVAITREADGRLALDGAGEPTEWAVEMQRFDENATLDRLADRGKVDPALADALARAVAAAHREAPVVEAEPWLDALADFITQNDTAFRAATDLFAARDTEVLTGRSRTALERLKPLLRARGEQQLVRHGHGDLHLGNIALIDGRPVPFDALEFDPLVAAGDVLYDLAFLLMDLTERGLPQAANTVLNRYLAETRRVSDLDAIAALPLFMSVRAAIRAKVTAARLDAAPDKRDSLTRAARTYFGFACSLIDPAPARLVAVGGLSGTGKSVLGRALASYVPPAPGAVHMRSDVARKVLFGAAETERLPAEAYSADVGTRVYAALYDKARRILGAGHSVVVDAVFARAEERTALASVAAAAGVRFDGLFLVADLATRLERVGNRRNDASDAEANVVAQQQNYQLGEIDWTEVDASGTPDDTLARARAAIEQAS
jgi:aminoglycoside phosphotransferase family enzyme/predicted kinase